LNQKKDFQNINNEIKEYVIKLKKLIYYKRKRNFYITAGGILSLNILSLLEYLNEYLDNNLNEDTKKVYILLENRRDIDKLKKFKKQSINFKDNELKDKIMLLCNYFMEFEQLKNHDYIHQSHEIPKSFNKIEIFKRDFNYNTMKFSYAFKLSICITISIFIMDYFKIYEARWMTYTVFSLIQPYREHSITKSKQRLKGSIIGGVIAFVMFSLINNKTIKSIIIAGAGYIDGYNTRYDRKMICVTISAVGVASMTSSIEVQLFYRILFVVAGIVLSLIANKVLLPYDLKDSTKDLINMSDSLIDSLKKENNDKKKDLIINLISEDINLKVKILKTALKDDDTEVVHYSSSILNMIEEEYEETINYLKKEYIKSESKKDLKQLLNIYYNYINSGLINKKLLDFDLKQYIEITEEYEERFDEDIELVIKKIDILIKSNKNQKALEVINKLNMRNIKEVYIYKLKALYNLKRYNQLIKESQDIKRMELELDEQLQSVLDFWS